MPTSSQDQDGRHGSSEGIRRFYDRLAHGEAERLVKDIPGRVSLEVHRRFLRRHIRPGWRALEVGAGPGRFTVELAALGASVVVSDLSPVQLALNTEFVTAAGAEHAVERREELDVRDLSRYTDDSFDAVLAFGGPLSYVFEAEQTAMNGLVRVTRPGGLVLASVMSRWGTWRAHLPGVLALEEQHGTAMGGLVLATGDLRHVPELEHVCRMFTWQEVADLVDAADARLVDSSASNWASLQHAGSLTALEQDQLRWQRFLDHEATACAAPGSRDGGTHIIFAAEPPHCRR
ncbi:class I SAM-dependent methyltransferase [Kitasatospora sp. LaBMicrA B282]|uniref:class I SAM-dependent methyltransferase n=1 Tax=Kitasatospora sp. LaBMicrA B282 TaxID=3420949 RepID=UPI003D10A8D3